MKGERPTRRSILKGVAAGITLAACSSKDTGGLSPDAAASGDAPQPITPPEAIPTTQHFVLGVSAGDLVGTSAVLWTKYAGTAPLAAFVWRMLGDSYVEEHGPLPATPVEGFVHVPIDGLVAGARYRYAFVELDGDARIGRSMIGKFRAPIADNAAEVLTFGAVACTDKSRPLSVLARAAERDDLDAFLFCGDNAYCDGATTLADYRDEYVQHFGRADHVAVRASTGMYITWDDHEIKNDLNPETIDEDQLAAAFKAFFEHAPIVETTPRKIWRSARWGKTAEIFVLDCRSERLPSTILSQNPQYISAAQMTWLKAGLAASPAAFKIIINSVPITNMPSVWDAYPTDRWEAYGAQRTDILRYIDDAKIEGVLWVSGDFHLAFISNVSTGGPGANQREVLVGPGAQTSNVLVSTLTGPQFSFATGTNNYTTLKLDPVGRSITVGYHDADGTMFHSESFVP
ncbi:MAG TPA: alkaline phosphatase D family protein [Kofleriaceae bacterium]